MKFAVLALTLLLAVASQAASVPAEEPSEVQLRYTAFKSLVQQVKDVLDRTMANSPDSQQLQSPAMISETLGHFITFLNNHEDVAVASISATHDMLSQMSGAGELSGELQAGINNLDTVFKAHLAEYNVLLRPILAEFKQASLTFSQAVAPKVEELRAEFRSNLGETLNAMGPVARTVMKMVTNFRNAASEFVDEYKRNAQEAYEVYESLTEEEKERRRAAVQEIGQEILAKVQTMYDIARGSPSAS